MSQDKCRLLGGVFESLVQASLGVICVSALIVKRHNEVPQRDWYVWFLDVMKQAIGSSFGHFLNIFLSVVIADSLLEADECQWYCLTYVVDSTVGTFINIVLLKFFEHTMTRCPDCKVMNFGDYGDPPQLCIWFPQLIVWMSIVVIAKLITLYMLLQFLYPLNEIISVIFRIFHDKPQIELVLVMVVIPTIMNTIQFWVTDTFLKRKVDEEVPDSELDEELMSGNRSTHDDAQGYRTASPMRTMSRLTGASPTEIEDSDGISLGTVNKKYPLGTYASVLSTDYESTEAGESGGGSGGGGSGVPSPRVGFSKKGPSGDSPTIISRKTSSAGGSGSSSFMGSFFSGLPTSWVGSSGALKIQRAGSDEALVASNPVHSGAKSAHSGSSSSFYNKIITTTTSTTPGENVLSGKTYTSASSGVIKQRTTGGGGVFTAGAHNTSIQSVSLGSSGGGGVSGSVNVGSGAGINSINPTRASLRSGSLDSDDIYL